MKSNGISLCMILMAIIYVLNGSVFSTAMSESPAEDNLKPQIYNISVAHGGYNLFEYGFSTYPLHSASYADRYAPENTYIYYDGENIELTYNKTEKNFFTQKHYYTNENGTISCGFYSEPYNGFYIYNLTAKNRIMFPDESVDTEDEYKSWVESLISQFRGLNFERNYGYEYVYSCETYVDNKQKFEPDSIVPGFYIPSVDEEVTKYVFNYVRYFEGYKTSDQRKVEIDLSEGTTSIYLHDKSLIDLKYYQNVDKAGGEQSVGSFLERKIDKYRYRLESYEIIDATLYDINDECCILYNVTVNYFDKEENQSETGEYLLLVHDVFFTNSRFAKSN